jgi:S1-C subfamily serine protease
VGINDERVKSYDDLYNVLDKYRPGEKVTVRVLRGKEVVAVPIPLIVVQ